jgi:uncharacterized protein (DUF302 family)
MTATSPSDTANVSSRQSPYGVGETLNRLEQVISGRGLKQFARFDHSDEAAKVGLTMPPAHVLVFGSPKAGTPLMLASPLIALELPLRVLVWQDQGGHVWVSYTEPSYLAHRFDIPADLTRVLTAVEGVVDAALHGVQPE